MNIILAPDSYKGSLTATEICEAMDRGIRKAAPNAHVIKMPMADGGEGSLTSLIAATGGSVVKAVHILDPLGRHIDANYGVIDEKETAIIELAQASGLHHLKEEELDPKKASSFGTGQLIRKALDDGYRSFIICLGGSATNDGGAGLLKALGYQFIDQNGCELEEGGLALQYLARIDSTHADPRLSACTFKVAGDVNNPLIGPNGASAIFGPQKGATTEDVEALDLALKQFADVTESEMGVRMHDVLGAGAAGGTAAGLVAFLGAEIVSGIELMKNTVGFDDLLKREQPDLILTGEGKVDAQTGFGKVIAGICLSSQKYGIPVVALAGAVSGDLQHLYNQGLTAAFAIAKSPMTLKESMKQASELVENQTEQVIRVFLSRKGRIS